VHGGRTPEAGSVAGAEGSGELVEGGPRWRAERYIVSHDYYVECLSKFACKVPSKKYSQSEKRTTISVRPLEILGVHEGRTTEAGAEGSGELVEGRTRWRARRYVRYVRSYERDVQRFLCRENRRFLDVQSPPSTPRTPARSNCYYFLDAPEDSGTLGTFVASSLPEKKPISISKSMIMKLITC